MSETNVQLFPGVFRSTVGGANPGFFLHSDGRVGIGNTAPEDRPAWDTDPASTAKNKLNVTGHTHITGSLNVTGHLYGDGSNLTGTALPWQQATSNPGTDIKYDNGGKIGIGGEPSSINILKVHGTVEALHVRSVSTPTGTGDAFVENLGGNATNRKPTECLRLTGQYVDSAGSGSLLRFTNYHTGGTNPNTNEYNTAGIAGFDYNNSWGGGLVLYTAPGTSGGGDLTPRMIIDNDGNVGIGGSPSSTNKLKVHGIVEATSFSGIQASDVPSLDAGKITTGTLGTDRIPTLSTSKISGLGTFATKNDGNYNIHDGWLRENGDNAHVKLYGGTRQMTFRTDGTTEYASGIGGYPFAWMYGGDHSSQRRMLLNTSGQLWCSNYGWLHDKFADRHGNSGYNFYTSTIFIGGSTSRGLRSVTGDYGTVQTTGGGNNGWEGYSIDGRYVFMSMSNNSCGIYNDIDNDWMIYCYRNNYTKLYYDGAERFETGNPNLINNAGLRIYGVEHSQDYADADHDYWQNWNQIQADTGYTHFGLYVDNAIRTYKYVALSDRRIKKDFLEIDDTIALGKLRQLKPTSYKYKDKWRRTTDRVLGFIAQEVAEVLPDAVSITNAVIPNIQIEASVKKIDEKKFEFTLKEPYVVTVGSKLELKGPKLGHKEVEVISVTDDTTFTGTTEDFNIEKVGDRVIVYGEYVDDFHNLDKNAIFTVATAALQEVDRQLQAEKEKVKSLEERLAALEAIVLNQ